MKRYRCDDCGSTSHVCVTEGLYEAEARRHRNIAHAGLIPDGERAIVEPMSRFLYVPRGQVIATMLLGLVMVGAAFVR
ncbi:hypothetical protein ABZ499_32955 [Streptomyces sp. NPDC019990]|uniref:hypothetical protein n=1 Tax=Streptomyces sp. NPDC019990 TaxID=3154693 RepID=UPI0033CDBD82